MEHDQNMIALNNHLQMTRLRQQKRYVVQPAGDLYLGNIHLLCFVFPFVVRNFHSSSKHYLYR